MNKQWFWLLLLLVGFSCGQEEPTRDEFDRMIEEEVQRRLDKWAANKWEQCEEALLEEAGELADSIILVEARRYAAQKDKPPKPAKPRRPGPIRLPDTLPLEPIFRPDTGRQADTSDQLGMQQPFDSPRISTKANLQKPEHAIHRH